MLILSIGVLLLLALGTEVLVAAETDSNGNYCVQGTCKFQLVVFPVRL